MFARTPDVWVCEDFKVCVQYNDIKTILGVVFLNFENRFGGFL